MEPRFFLEKCARVLCSQCMSDALGAPAPVKINKDLEMGMSEPGQGFWCLMSVPV